MVKYELRVHVRDVISSVFWGILISFKINKEENTTTFPYTKEKIKLLAILYSVLSIFNFVMLTIFN